MLIIEQIAKSIRYYMEANTVRNQQLSNGVKFENLLREYFRKKDCIIQELSLIHILEQTGCIKNGKTQRVAL